MIRVGVVGTRFGALCHVPAFAAQPDVEVVAIAGRDPARTTAVAAKLGIPRAYAGHRRMLDRCELDLLTVATPPETHASICFDAIACGVGILCEKPLAPTPEQALRLVEAADAAGVVHGTCFEFRFAPSRAAVASHMAAIGAPRVVSALEVSGLGPAFPCPPSRATLHGSHTVDMLLQLLGPVGTVAGATIGSDGGYAAVLELASGAIATLAASQRVAQGARRLEVWGTEGAMSLLDERQLLYGRQGEEREKVWRDSQTWSEQGPVHGDLGLIRRCFDELARETVAAVCGEPSRLPTFHDGLAAVAVLEAVSAAAERGRASPVEPAPYADAGCRSSTMTPSGSRQ
jgi:predicted dehydrogenase